MKKLYILLFILVFGFSLRGYTSIIYVNRAATGSNTGANWANAYTSLQTALTASISGDQIWVAKGTYYPSSAYSLTEDGDRDFHFEMKNGVAIYGGFAGTETATTERTNFGYGQTNETILSGDIGTVGDSADNCYRVFYHTNSLGLTNTAILDGFTITGANANKAGLTTTAYKVGGGMYNQKASPTLCNLTFVANYASLDGGGMYNTSASKPILNNVAFISNRSGIDGGGLCNFSSSPSLVNVTFTSNSSALGGAMYNGGASAPTLTDVAFSHNLAGSGGGMHNNNGGGPVTLTRVTFYADTANHGGGIYNTNTALTLNDVSFTSERARYGGGIYNSENTVAHVFNNVTFSSNKASDSGGGLYNVSASPTINNATFYSNKAQKGGGIYNETSSPTLNNVTLFFNNALYGGGIYSAASSTITMSNSIVWGNTATYLGIQFYAVSTASVALSYSCYSYSTNDVYNLGTFTPGNSITTDPKFVDASNGDCRLYSNSPCVDNGNNIYNTTSKDIRGQTRVQNTTIDMGAYEWTDGLDVVCANPSDGGEIASDQEICTGNTPVAFTNISAPTTACPFEYQWQLSTISATEGFNNIELAVSEAYTPAVSADTTWFKRIVKASCISSWTDAAVSNIVKVVIHKTPTFTESNNTYFYNGTQKAATVNISNIETIDWFDAETNGNSVSAPSGTDAGTYQAYAQIRNIVAGCTSNNRTLVTLTIKKTEVSVTPNANQSKVYGETDPVLTYTCAPTLATGNTFTGALVRTEGENVGSYPIASGTLSAGDNYSITLVESNFTIAPKQLTITDPVLTTTKEYDGNTTAAVTAGTLSGVLTSDEGKVTVSASANYTDANVGTGKTINVTYTLGGDASGNYLSPSNYSVIIGIIKEKITDGLNILSIDVTPLHVYPNPVISGQPVTIEITGVSEQDLKGSVLKVFNISGELIYSSAYSERMNFNEKYGNYILRITTPSGKILDGKITIAK